jgi:hypothetical protein
MLILECSQDGTDGRSVTISLHNFVGEGIKSSSNDISLNRKPLYEKYILISLYHVFVDNSKIVSIILAPWQVFVKLSYFFRQITSKTGNFRQM